METNYIIDKDFPFGLEEFLLCQKEIENRGLQIIVQIEAKHITQDSDELKALFEVIESKCKNKRLWVLFGSDDSKNWLPLQVASVFAEKSDIRSEIKKDFIRMTPYDPDKDVKEWRSKFYGAIMEVKIGQDVVCQKYSTLRKKCFNFAIAILEKEEYCNEDVEIISKYQKKEIELAYELKPLIWNPSPIEKKYIKYYIEKNSNL